MPSRPRAAAATSPPRALRRSAAAALAAAFLLLPATHAGAADQRFLGQVTDTLRTPAHRLAAGADGRALADLVFVDRASAGTAFRTCVSRLGPGALHTCFNTTSGSAGSATVTPLRFQRGRYAVAWAVAGDVVARWRFRVL
jgi:hypothetical protein